MSNDRQDVNAKDLQRRFSQAAATFGSADFVHKQVLAGLMQRMSPLVISPTRILDLGAGTGPVGRRLAKSYRKSTIASLDLSDAMLRVAKKDKPWFSKMTEIRGDATRIPFANDSFDLICASLMLPWIDNLPAVFAEVARILRKGGVFAFATLGPDSFSELRRAWSSVDSGVHVREFPDMHDIGDAMLQNRLSDPVLDVDYLTVTYKDTATLYSDLTACGARNTLLERRQTLTGKHRFARMEKALSDALAANAATADTVSSAVTLTLEIVYGHAWGSGPATLGDEFHIDAGAIKVRDRVSVNTSQ